MQVSSEPVARRPRTRLAPDERQHRLLEVAVEFFDGVGLPVESILARSDLHEREGKNQHAFCIDVDRSGDVRVLLNLKPTARWMSTVLHELGHVVGLAVGHAGLVEVGAAGADSCADADAARDLAGPDAGGLSCGRFVDQHHHAADAVLPARGRVLPALREEYGHWHAHGHDVAVLDVVPADLDHLPAAVLCGRSAARIRGQLHVPADLGRPYVRNVCVRGICRHGTNAAKWIRPGEQTASAWHSDG